MRPQDCETNQAGIRGVPPTALSDWLHLMSNSQSAVKEGDFSRPEQLRSASRVFLFASAAEISKVTTQLYNRFLRCQHRNTQQVIIIISADVESHGGNHNAIAKSPCAES